MVRQHRRRAERGALDRPIAYSIPAASEASGLSRSFLYEEMKAGRLPYVKMRRRRLIMEDDLRARLAQDRVEAG